MKTSRHQSTPSPQQEVARQQAGFVAAILDIREHGTAQAGHTAAGFPVHQRNLYAVAQAALAITFPTIERYLDAFDFRALAVAQIYSHPLESGDWAEWGESFPDLIEQAGIGREFPFLAPLARLDWNRHRSARAVDNVFDRESLQLLETDGVDAIGIAIARHVRLLSSTYPLLELQGWDSGQKTARDTLTVAQLPRPVLICRRQYEVEQRYIGPAEHLFLDGLLSGRPVGRLLDELVDSDFDFARWLEGALRQNMINHFYRL